VLQVEGRPVYDMLEAGGQADDALLGDFASEWERYGDVPDPELDLLAGELFDMLPEGRLAPDVRVVDIGCGGGRWSRWLSRRTGHVDALDPSDAVLHAARHNADRPNIRWSKARGEALPFPDGSFDLAICVGVLHHVADPQQLLREAYRVLRSDGRLYFYVYYALEDRGAIYKGLYHTSDLLRRMIHPLPFRVKHALSLVLASVVYLPLVVLVRMLKALGLKVWQRMPLAFYHNKSFRIMRNDALDRFGTSVEVRFSRDRINSLLEGAGFHRMAFSPHAPYWHGIATKKD
jgi:ubiquinone/menaquinone biosynthesis C-methylase UbiE